MPYESTVLQKAKESYQTMLRQKQQEADRLKTRAYALNPRIQQIDQILRGTAGYLVKITLEKAPPSAFEQIRSENLALQEERNHLLRQLNINPNDLGTSSFCPDCLDHGFMGKTMCRCFQEHCISAQLQELNLLLQGNLHQFSNFALDCYSSQQWEGHPSSPRENMTQVVEICKAYSQDLKNFPFQNLLLTGSAGLGKTFLSGCIAREVSMQGFSVQYGTANQIFEQFQLRQFRKTDDGDYHSAKESTKWYLSCDLLVLDDLGSEFTTVVTDSAFYELVNSRLLAGLHTVISSNLSMEEMANRYPPQVLSRFEGEYHNLMFYGEDLRKVLKHQRLQ